MIENNTQSTEYIDPDIEFLLKEHAEQQLREAEKKTARTAKNAPESDFSARGRGIKDTGIGPKKATISLDNRENNMPDQAQHPASHKFLLPVTEAKEFCFDCGKMYIDAGFNIYPVKENNGYYLGLTQNDSGLDGKGLANWINNYGVLYYRTILPRDIIVIDLDRKKGKDGIRVFNDWLTKQGIRTGELADVENGSRPFTTRVGSGGGIYILKYRSV